jgi:competence protein ComGC
VHFACYEKDAEQMAMLCMVGLTVVFIVSVLLIFVYKNLVTEETVSISFEERECRQLLVERMTAIIKENINVNA